MTIYFYIRSKYQGYWSYYIKYWSFIILRTGLVIPVYTVRKQAWCAIVFLRMLFSALIVFLQAYIVRFGVCFQVFRCLHKMAPEYLSTYCQPVSGISGRRHLRSADRGHLDLPRVKLASYGGRSFAYAGPSNWNSLPAHLRDNSLSHSSFKRNIKTFLFSFYQTSARSAFGVLFFLQKNALYTFTVITFKFFISFFVSFFMVASPLGV